MTPIAAMQGAGCWPRVGRVLLAVALAAACMLLNGADAMTRQDQVDALNKLREAAFASNPEWRNTLRSWTCPTDPADSDAECDPCSKDWSGNWEFIHCRGSSGAYGEGSKGDFDGYVTTVHITDQELPGSPPKEFCGLSRLRELDLDGSAFTGPLPPWIITCFPDLQELDLSYNRFSGTLPWELSKKTTLQEIKVEHNNLMGTIPPSLADMPALRVLRLEYNHFSGTIPKEFSKLVDTLNDFQIGYNNFTGDLSPLAKARPMTVTVSHNPHLCGMVPAGVRYAHGYNPEGTRLGKPCD